MKGNRARNALVGNGSGGAAPTDGGETGSESLKSGTILDIFEHTKLRDVLGTLKQDDLVGILAALILEKLEYKSGSPERAKAWAALVNDMNGCPTPDDNTLIGKIAEEINSLLIDSLNEIVRELANAARQSANVRPAKRAPFAKLGSGAVKSLSQPPDTSPPKPAEKPPKPRSKTSTGKPAEGADNPESLHNKYAKAFTEAYQRRQKSIDELIATGELPEQCRMPDLDTFKDKIETGAETFNFFMENDWDPEIVFVPDIPIRLWNKLFAAHGHTVDRKWVSLLEDTEGEGAQTEVSWGYAIVCAKQKPPFCNVSRDGKRGPEADETIDKLKEVFPVSAADDRSDIMTQASPSLDAYLALQLGRLERKLPLVDSESFTFLSNIYSLMKPKDSSFIATYAGNGVIWVFYVYFVKGYPSAESWPPPDGHQPNGLRPSVEWR